MLISLPFLPATVDKILYVIFLVVDSKNSQLNCCTVILIFDRYCGIFDLCQKYTSRPSSISTLYIPNLLPKSRRGLGVNHPNIIS